MTYREPIQARKRRMAAATLQSLIIAVRSHIAEVASWEYESNLPLSEQDQLALGNLCADAVTFEERINTALEELES